MIAAATAEMMPQLAMPARAPKSLVIAPTMGAPKAEPPTKTSMYRPITRPRSSAWTDSWT